MRDDFTDITALVDRSGSMSSIKYDMEGGFNTMLEDQKKESGRCQVSLYSFDGSHWPQEVSVLQLETHYEGQDISRAGKLNLIPRGCTPLLDALAEAIRKTGERLKDIPEHRRPGRVIFVIITDGLENASVMTTREQVMEMINRQTDQYKWTFMYLGANQDAIQAGTGMGVKTGSSLTYTANRQGTQAMAASVSKGISALRSDSRVTYEAKSAGDVGIFSKEDREEQEKAAGFFSKGKSCRRCVDKTSK